MLRAEDRKKIQEYVMSAAEGINEFGLGVSGIEKNWAVAKDTQLFQLFDGELILEKEFVYEKPLSELKEMLDTDEALKSNRFRRVFRKILMSDSVKYKDYLYLSTLMNYKVLAQNRVDESFQYEITEEEVVGVGIFGKVEFKPGKIKVSKGQKPIKALRKLLTMFGLKDYEDDFEKFFLRVSQVLNDKTSHGKLCLSIHPLDYMTMSHNNHNWTSCMSWVSGDGCYQAGTLEMMNCPSTLVAYLKSSDDENDTRLSGCVNWNSKKWRTLVHVNEEGILVNKNYPMHNRELAKEVARWVKELAETNLGYRFNKELTEDEDDFAFETYCHMYDDFSTGSADPIGYLAIGCSVADMQVGGSTYCLECGEGLDIEDAVVCSDCNGHNKHECDCCGDLEHEDDMYGAYRKDHWSGRYIYEYVCSHCLDNNYCWCPRCDEYIHNDDMEEGMCGACRLDEEKERKAEEEGKKVREELMNIKPVGGTDNE